MVVITTRLWGVCDTEFAHFRRANSDREFFAHRREFTCAAEFETTPDGFRSFPQNWLGPVRQHRHPPFALACPGSFRPIDRERKTTFPLAIAYLNPSRRAGRNANRVATDAVRERCDMPRRWSCEPAPSSDGQTLRIGPRGRGGEDSEDSGSRSRSLGGCRASHPEPGETARERAAELSPPSSIPCIWPVGGGSRPLAIRPAVATRAASPAGPRAFRSHALRYGRYAHRTGYSSA